MYGIPDSLSVELGFRILILIVSGIPDSKAQDWRFHKQKFARFRNPDSVTWGEARHANLDTFLTVTSNESKKNGKNKTRIIMAACT